MARRAVRWPEWSHSKAGLQESMHARLAGWRQRQYVEAITFL